jgi:DNA polymerase (family 10)
MENTQIADVFDEIADMLDLQGDNPFRIRSYRSAAQTIRGLSGRLEEMAAEGKRLSDIPHVGEAISRKILEILATGTCKRREELRRQMPPGLIDMLKIPGLGPRKAMQLHKALQISSIAELEQACRRHRVRDLEGMGDKTEQKILDGIRTVRSVADRISIRDASEQLASLAAHLGRVRTIARWEVAGSFRRGRETIGDLDLLIEASDRGAAADGILRYDSIGQVISRGAERVSVRLKRGTQVDFRFFDKPAFGAALMYFTGSKAHNIHARRLAQDKEWKLNEYGLFKGGKRLAGKTEAAVYGKLGLPWIPPELREDRGEIEAAQERRLPALVEPEEIRGDLQCHTTASDGQHSIREMGEAAAARGLEYLAITDHSKRVTMAHGLDDDATRRHAEEIRRTGGKLKGVRLLAGIEVDILKSGKLDLREKTLASLDWVVAGIHYDRSLGKKAMTDRYLAAIGSGVVHCIAHPLGRIIGQRDPLELELDRLFEACAGHGVFLEINAQPDRLDLPDVHCQRAREAGVRFSLATDAHSVSGLDCMRYGVTVARRGWLSAGDIVNTRPFEKVCFLDAGGRAP